MSGYGRRQGQYDMSTRLFCCLLETFILCATVKVALNACQSRNSVSNLCHTLWLSSPHFSFPFTLWSAFTCNSYYFELNKFRIERSDSFGKSRKDRVRFVFYQAVLCWSFVWTLCWSWSIKISRPVNRLFPLSTARSCKLQFWYKSEVFRIIWNCEICQSNMAAVVSSFYQKTHLLLFGTLHLNFWHWSKILCVQSFFI